MEQEFTKVIDLLYLAKQNGVEILLVDQKLQLKIPENSNIDKDLLTELRNNKQLIIDFLSSDNWKSKRVTKNYKKIERVDKTSVDRIPLSFSQERLWFIDRLEGSVVYNAPIVLRLGGHLNIAALEQAFQGLIRRHEILRTVYLEENGSVYQQVLPYQGWSLAISQEAKALKDSERLHPFIETLIRKPFDLSKDFTIRAHLLEMGAQDYILVLTIHHIASDGWSLPIIVREVVELYNASVEDREPSLPELSLQFADYAIWQRKYLQGAVLEDHAAYWRKKLEDVAVLQMPADFVRPAVVSTKGASKRLSIDKTLSDKIVATAEKEGVTLYMLLLAAFKVLLYRYSGQEDISVGTSIASREQNELSNLVGFFVNTLALRTQVNGEEPFRHLLQDVRSTTLEAYEHQELPFEKVVEVALKERDGGRSPLFQVMLVLHNTPEGQRQRLGEVNFSSVNYEHVNSKFDFTFFVSEGVNGLHIIVEYATDLYRGTTIERMLEHYRNLLEAVTVSLQQRVGELRMLSETEKTAILKHSTSIASYPQDASVVTLFEARAAQHAQTPAVVFDQETISYEALNSRANQLARYLRSRGVTTGSLVPLFIERGLDMLAGMLGILKSGAGYVPVDIDFPATRVRYMIADSGSQVVVSSMAAAPRLWELEDLEVIEIDGDNYMLQAQAATNPGYTGGSSHIAYVIYTSGSTGTPKGVQVTHRNLVDYYFGIDARMGLSQYQSFALVSTIATDLGNTIIYGALLSGGTLHVIDKARSADGYYLGRYLQEQQVECVKIVPSHWQALSASGQLVLPCKLLMFGGEALPAKVIAQLQQAAPELQVVNHYGPTETTIGKLLYEVPGGYDPSAIGNTVPIGKPFGNTSIYVLSKELQLCPPGVSGQLYIGGDGVASGYLNNPDLTAQKFIVDPIHQGAGLVYATGDLVRSNEQGDIVFLGRADDQVKVRGYRIEPGEIANVMRQSGLVSQVVVLARGDKSGEQRLTGYVVGEAGYDREALQDYLQERLPEYMIPTAIVALEQMPLTANGKIDRKALPDAEAGEAVKGAYVAPRNDLEAKLSDIWQEILEVERVGVNDDFFELGGHSLLAVRVISAIRKELQAELPISDVFDYPTVGTLSGRLQQQLDSKEDAGEKQLLPAITVAAPRPEHIPLSFSQERLWFIDRLEGSVQYHVNAVLRLNGELNRDALDQAFKLIVDRHQVLRTVFLEHEGRPYQKILDASAFGIQYEVLASGSQHTDAELKQRIERLIKTPYDLSRDFMLRVHLLQVSSDSYVLVVTIHHIASDRWSRYLLVKELVALYHSATKNEKVVLPELPIQYADFAIWQQDQIGEVTYKRKLDYWKNQLNEVEVLKLPTDFERPVVQSTKGAMFPVRINRKLTESLHQLSQQQNVTLFMTMLAAFDVLLSKYSGQTDICIGTAVAGRQHQELENLVGFFVNTLALRNHIEPEETFAALLGKVRQTTLGAYANQEIPFDRVVEAIVGNRNLSTDPLIQVMFGFQNSPEIPELVLGDVKLSIDHNPNHTALFELFVNLVETDSGMIGFVQYSTDIYSEVSIKRLCEHYERLLWNIVEQPYSKVGALSLLSHQERKQIVEGFNATKHSYRGNRSIVEIFTERAQQTPCKIAVCYHDKMLTYAELDRRSNQLANRLLESGVERGNNIGLLSYRSFEMLIGILGILKAGCTYVPLNTSYPPERLRLLVNDASIKHLVYNDEILLRSSGLHGDVKLFNASELSGFSDMPTGIVTGPSDPVYIMYTSGTTGVPKGIVVANHNVIKLVFESRDIAIHDTDVVLQWSNYSFDGCTYEIFCGLLNGAQLVLIEDDWASDAGKLAEVILSEKVSVHFVTTALFNAYIDVAPDIFRVLRKLLFGGEKVSVDHVSRALEVAGPGKIVHVYGPTETTVYATFYPVDAVAEDAFTIPIGRPLDNTILLVVDKQQNLLPVGVPGELWIGGDGVSHGYLNRADLTDKHFVECPVPELSGRFYRTGDLVRWTANGDIEFFGRIDQQVKIRGYRIELEEIESILIKTGMVSQAAVIAKEELTGTRRLVSYVVPAMSSVKSREGQLYLNLVNSWKELYEIEYRKTEADSTIDPEFNIIGWNDSFTGGAIPADNMREWLTDIMDVIRQQKPSNVLEIGTGTGLIFYQLAGSVKKYIGTDFSRSSMKQIEDRIGEGLKDYGPVELHVCPAHDLSIDASEEIDTVILNSIIQYFPGELYMREVMAKSIAAIKGSGKIIVGDVRDNRLLEHFKGRLNLQKLQQSASIKEFKWVTDQDILKEEELCLSPEYFYWLQQQFPEIKQVEIRWKNASYQNELSLYRYTAILSVGTSEEALAVKWEPFNADAKSFETALSTGVGVLAISDVPNPRLWREHQLAAAMTNPLANTVGDLQEAIQHKDEGLASIQALLEMAEQFNYCCRLLLNEDPFKMDIVFEKTPSSKLVTNRIATDRISDPSALTNIPLFTDISAEIQKDVRAALKKALPEYMVPSEIITLRKLPLNSSGKVDRKFLSEREDRGLVSSLTYQSPRTETENALTNIWQSLLAIERIGVFDNFFELGGHSLLATRVLSGVKKMFNVSLEVKELFLNPTVASLAAKIDSSAKSLASSLTKVTLRPKYIPSSFAQERLWFIDQLEGSVAYHMPVVLRIKGQLDHAALERAFRQLLERHEVLRTIFKEFDGQVYQEVIGSDAWKLQVVDLFNDSKTNVLKLQDLIQQAIKKPFDLSADFMLRAWLISVRDEESVLVVNIHHIASDGWSLSIAVKELTALYKEQSGVSDGLYDLPVQYADYAIWQREYLKGNLLDDKLAYWKNQLSGVVTLDLPADFQRPYVRTLAGASTTFTVEAELLEKLQSLARDNNASLFMTLLAAFQLMLSKYSGQDDICVGTSTANRTQPEVEGLIGFFVNLLALRTQVHYDRSFNDLLKQVRQTTLEAYQHQDVSFEKVVEVVLDKRDTSHSPLFQVMFVLLNLPEIPALKLGDAVISYQNITNSVSKYDLTFLASETRGQLNVTVQYSTELFRQQTISSLIENFEALLHTLVQYPQKPLKSLDLASQHDVDELLDINRKSIANAAFGTITAAFEAQVALTPQAVALVYEQTTLSYRELNQKANSLAARLSALGLSAGQLIPVFLDRGPELLIAMLAILKAGGAYVPVDVTYPAERVSFMLTDTDAKWVVSNSDLAEKIGNIFPKVKIILADDVNTLNDLTGNPRLQVDGDPIAYVMYTSGSTGVPKGVLVTHKNIVSLVRQVHYVSLSASDTILSTGTPSFDATTFEYWGALLNGGKLVLCRETTILNPEFLREEIRVNAVTKMWFTAGLFNQLIDTDLTIFQPLKVVIVGGEKLSPTHVALLRTAYPGLAIINGYGPTENTTFSLTYPITDVPNTAIPIGSPLSNRTVYIVDEFGNLLPKGVPGEVWVGGAGVARGYLNQPALTSEKFIDNPFPVAGDKRLYKTGDIGRWLPEGVVAYIGRKDQQVKIRGYRIEPEEIERVLMQSEEVSQAVVLVKEDDQAGKMLVAFVVSEFTFDKFALDQFLQSRLPDYMLPSSLVPVDAIPLTKNGKVDKQALLLMQSFTTAANAYVAPRNALEQGLADIWQDVLEVDQVGINDDFFELGGHSLLAVRVISSIRKKLNVEVNIEDLFQNLTVASLAGFIAGKHKHDHPQVDEFRYLVPIKSGQGNIPLYIIAGGGGTVFTFKQFADMLSSNQPVYGLQQPTQLANFSDFPTTIEGIAREYISEILRSNPAGPYALSGHCLGGVVAYEIAKQLQEMGKEVKLLTMFDTVIRKRAIVEPASIRNFYHIPRGIRRSLAKFYLKVDFQAFLLRKHSKQAIRYKLRKLRSFADRVNPYKPKDMAMEVFKKLELNFVKAATQYRLTHYDGDIVVFYAKEHYYFLDKDNNVGYKKLYLNENTKNVWKEYVRSVTMYEIEGEHSTIFYPVHAAEFVRILQHHLDEASK